MRYFVCLLSLEIISPTVCLSVVLATLCAKTMNYRGIGSGIIRALQSDANIDFINETSGDQFRVVLWRNVQKYDSTVFKGGMKTGKKTDPDENFGMKTGKKTDTDEN